MSSAEILKTEKQFNIYYILENNTMAILRGIAMKWLGIFIVWNLFICQYSSVFAFENFDVAPSFVSHSFSRSRDSRFQRGQLCPSSRSWNMKVRDDGPNILSKKNMLSKTTSRFSLLMIAQAYLPNLAFALDSNADAVQDSSQIRFLAKCALSLALVAVLISLFIPPKITNVETVDRPPTREDLDKVVNDLIESKRL